jgi:hypothetical protein
MTTKEQMAIDVFTEGTEIIPNIDYVYVYPESHKYGFRLSYYEMAELNDLAVGLFEWRTSDWCDVPWHLENE